MRSERIRDLSILVALVASGASSSSALAGATFYPLGDLPGGTFHCRACGVSADGTTVVGNSVSSNGLEAFRWTIAGGLVGIGDLAGGSVFAEALAVSADGSVIVGNGNSANGTEAFRWTAAGGMVGLGDLPGGPFFSDAWAVNADGSVVVGRARSTASGGNFEAFRWVLGSGMTGLGDFAGSSFSSRATGVSADGSIVVGLGSAPLGADAFRWTSLTGMVGLGDFAGGVNNSVANAISGDGTVIVGWGSSTLGTEAFRHDASGMIGLGMLPAGGFSSTAFATNADGSIVVGDASTLTGGKAFIWDATHGIRDLKEVLVNDYGLNLGTWKLERATGISADGSVISGWGTNPSNQTDSWVVVIDPPCAPGNDLGYGAGKPGSTGVPLLDAPSPAVVGADSPIRISNALPGAASFLALGLSAASLPFDGGTLLVAPLTVLAIPLPIKGDGTLMLPFPLPADPALCGFVVYLQLFCVDPGAAGFYHLSLTNGLKRTFGGP